MAKLYDKYTDVYTRLFRSDKRIIVSRGGTRSSKTYSKAQLLVRWLITGRFGKDYLPNAKASIVRKYLPALKATILEDVKEILYEHKLMKEVDWHKTDKVFSFEGRTLDYFSADDQQKVRGRKRDILVCNEGNELVFKKEFQQLLFRTTGKILIDFNPDDPDIWINTELEINRMKNKGDVEVIVSTYKDNQYLSQELIEEIEWTKHNDPETWQVFGLGEYGKITGLIYPSATIINDFPWELCEAVVYGLDWGFIHPMGLVRVGIDNFRRKVYLQQLYYEREKQVLNLIEKLPELKVMGNDLIYCDSARPGHIQELFNAGWRGAQPAIKGQGSVEGGINKMKSYELCITSDSIDLINERKKYKWAVDKNGDYIEGKPIKDHDHLLDSARYALYSHDYAHSLPLTRRS